VFDTLWRTGRENEPFWAERQQSGLGGRLLALISRSDHPTVLSDLESSTEWIDWLAGRELRLVIDGLDEGLALAPHFLASLVADLRIASRRND
jgi:hypothetical protein